jgi:hypothetical protein
MLAWSIAPTGNFMGNTFRIASTPSALALSVMVAFKQGKPYSMSEWELAWDQNGLFVL